FGVGSILALILGSSGFFFLPYLPFVPSLAALGGGAAQTALGVLSSGAPAWDRLLLGALGHGNLLVYSALLPVLLVIVGYGAVRLRPALAMFSVGVGAHLVFAGLFSLIQVRWLPFASLLGTAWLVANGLVALLLARFVARK